MWEISIALQLEGFFKALVLGAIFCLLTDLLRSLQEFFSLCTLWVIVSDLFLTFLEAIITFCFLLAITLGEVRFYVIFGLVVGYFAVRLLLSRHIFKFLLAFFNLICRRVLSFRAFLGGKIANILHKIANKCGFLKIFQKKSKLTQKNS